jgi:DNA-binding beta-propeller fold protein YncE
VVKEFEYSIDAALGAGLLPSAQKKKNVAFMETMQNAVPWDGVAVSPTEVTYPKGEATMEWPFPQLFRGEHSYIEAGEYDIYNTGPALDWAKSAIPLVKVAGGAATIARAGAWQFVPFQDKWLLSNGKTLIWKLAHGAGTVYADSDLQVAAIGKYRSRLVVGGCADTTGWFAGAQFLRLFAKWKATEVNREYRDSNLTVDSRWIFWGEVEGKVMDSPHHLMLVMLGLYGSTVYDNYEEKLLDMMDKGEIGMAPIRTAGDVLAVHELGARLFVYSTQGICELTANESGFKMEVVDTIGLLSRCAIHATDTEHVWMTPECSLMRNTYNNGMTPHDYRTYLQQPKECNIRHFVMAADEGLGTPALDAEDRLVIPTKHSHRVVIIDLEGNEIDTFGSVGPGDGQFIQPSMVWYDPDDDEYYVVDKGNDRIQKFDGSYAYMSKSAAAMDGPTYMWKEGSLLVVADTNNDRVYLMQDDFTGATTFGSTGTGNGQFDGPTGVCVYNNEIYVCDFNNNRIQVFDIAGVFSRKFTGTATLLTPLASGGFYRPRGIWIEDDEIYYADGRGAVIVMDLEGEYLRHFADGITYENFRGVFVKNGIVVTTDRNDGLEGPPYGDPDANPGDGLRLWRRPERLIMRDDLEDHYWIAACGGTYVLGPEKGLGGPMDIEPTNVFRDREYGLVGAAHGQTDSERTMLLRYTPFDIKERDYKTVSCVQVDTENLSAQKVNVAHRVVQGGAYKESELRPVNIHGFAFPHKAFIDGKVIYRGTYSTDKVAHCARMEVRWIGDGKRASRGTSGVPDGGGE